MLVFILKSDELAITSPLRLWTKLLSFTAVDKIISFTDVDKVISFTNVDKVIQWTRKRLSLTRDDFSGSFVQNVRNFRQL